MEKCDKCIWSTRSGGCVKWTCEFVDQHEAYEAWNRRADTERTAKVMKHHYDFDPRKDSFYQGLGGTELLCGNCKKKVIVGDDYCSHCGARLEWE